MPQLPSTLSFYHSQVLDLLAMSLNIPKQEMMEGLPPRQQEDSRDKMINSGNMVMWQAFFASSKYI